MALQSLTAVFDRDQAILKEKLQGLNLPSDSSRIQNIINDYLNEIFKNEGDFRQGLTQSEDYILQAALSLLNAQRSITKEITPSIVLQGTEPKQQPLQKASKGLKKEQYPIALAGTSLGGGIGGALLGTWGAVFGAIAGTAVVLYYASAESEAKPSTKMISIKEEKPSIVQFPLDVDLFISIIKSICESIDSLIDTFRSQINKVIHKYENQEKPSLEREYRFLLEGIQSLIGYKRSHNEDEKFAKKVQERIEEIVDLLDNYNLVVEDYSEVHKSWFDEIVSPNTSELTQVLPAIIKNGHVVLKGRVFIPENQN
ncbi:hypothetical protein [Phocaeicola plebeius]|uniref:hypothetical protein n=1 Tax=Phocaeicola plebeius TaxID=310297 RepID=UPI002942C28B|nr:hypothetical protein [Phocaeicola plebeius]